jgi:hypothetical protein
MIIMYNRVCDEQDFQSRTRKDDKLGFNIQQIFQYAANLQTSIFFRPSRSTDIFW